MVAKLNHERPYAEMCGEEGVKYLQNGKYYDTNGFFVRESGLPVPTAPKPISTAEKVLKERMEAHQKALANAASMLGPLGRKTKLSIQDEAELENRRALAAEERIFA